ncbi:MAG: hypothetical protein ACREDV_13370, partial [Methylocella sp.]
MHEPLLSIELWERAQGMMDGRHVKKSKRAKSDASNAHATFAEIRIAFEAPRRGIAAKSGNASRPGPWIDFHGGCHPGRENDA